MTAPTPAQHLAEFLRALAQHLDAHPHLAPVGFGIHFRTLETALHVHEGGADNVRAWARTVGATEITARWISATQLMVEAPGRVGDHQVRVWGVAPELADEVSSFVSARLLCVGPTNGDTVLPVEETS